MSQPMAISIWQPYASLLAFGEKRYETRSWAAPSKVIGMDVVIHAAKSEESLYMCSAPHFTQALWRHGIDETIQLPLGAALCVATLVAVYKTDDLRNLSISEKSFGDFTPGRYAWWFDNIRLFARPFPCRGQQGLWQWSGFLPALKDK